jgi:hypothetical protein
MSTPSTSTTERCSRLQPLRSSYDVILRGVMAAVLVAASWGSGSIIPARMILAIPNAGPAVPIAPSEEHENHSSTPLVVDSSGSAKCRARASDSTNHRRVKALTRQCLVLPPGFELPLCSHSDGHRLANGLMAPMTV